MSTTCSSETWEEYIEEVLYLVLSILGVSTDTFREGRESVTFGV